MFLHYTQFFLFTIDPIYLIYEIIYIVQELIIAGYYDKKHMPIKFTNNLLKKF